MSISITESGDFDPRLTVNEITESVAAEVRDWLNAAIHSGSSIVIMTIDSPGGDIYALLSILDYIAYAQARGVVVVTFGTGKCFSSAVTLLAAGSSGYRFASPSLSLMDHQPSTVSQGSEDQMVQQTKELVRLGKKVNLKLEQYTECEPGFFNAKIKEAGSEWYFDARTAKRFGIVDSIGIPGIKHSTSLGVV